MTASTNTILLKTEDSDTLEERDGVFYAEEAYHPDRGVGGVAIQYASEARNPGNPEPETEFIPNARIVGVYDDIAEEPLVEYYREYVEDN